MKLEFNSGSQRLGRRALFGPALRGVRDCAAPGIGLQIFALSIVLGYFFIPSVRDVLDGVGELKDQYGYLFSALSTILFGAFIPFSFLALTGRVRPARRLTELRFLVLFWCWRGLEVDAFYRFQAFLFGSEANLSTVAAKVAFDQFVYTPFWVVPTQTALFLYKDSGYSSARMKELLVQQPIPHRLLTVLLSNWAVWIPAVSIIYTLPSPLQLPLCNFVLCFWCLLVSFMSREDSVLQ